MTLAPRPVRVLMGETQMTLALPPHAVVPSVRRLTAEEFSRLPDTRGKELDDGVIVELNVGTESNLIAGELYRRLANHVIEQRLGLPFPPETAFQCFPKHPARVRKPDVSFIRADRVPAGPPPKGFMPVAPDLVVEVVSPHDGATDVERKIREYAEIRIPLLWVIYPDTGTARLFRSGKATGEVGADDDLDGGDVVPDFRARLRDLFPAGSAPVVEG